MDGAPHLPYTGVGLDREGSRRKDPAFVAGCLAAEGTRLVPMRGERSFLPADPSVPGAATPVVTEGLRAALRESATDVVLLGVRDGVAFFAADVDALGDDGALTALLGPGTFRPLRDIRTRLDDEHLALLGYARALLHWHRANGFCPTCGAPNRPAEGGHVRICPNGHSQYPRISPAVIMLVTSDEGEPRCVLGRHGGLPTGVYSTLAGFVEAGESLEETVAREVAEEVGLAVEGIVYQASQPWPFPGQLMVGFHATAKVGPLRVDRDELDEAHWFTLDEVRAFGEAEDVDATYRLPRRDSIARFLVERWLRRYADVRPRANAAP
jgi:NAD+ diphosphatase